MRQKSLAMKCLEKARWQPVSGDWWQLEIGDAYHRHVLVIAKQNPELDQGQETNPGNGKQTNPLDADSRSQTEAGHGEPEPPGGREGLGGAELVLVGEGGEGKCGKGSGDHQGRVEEDQPHLRQEAILCTRG